MSNTKGHSLDYTAIPSHRQEFIDTQSNKQKKNQMQPQVPPKEAFKRLAK